MTLALYGKSKRRQALLVLLGILVVLLGSVAALGARDSGRAAAGDTGWMSPALDGSSVLNSANSPNGFTNGDRAKTQNDTFASTITDVLANPLAAHGYGSFSFAIPADQTVTGIEVRADAWTRRTGDDSCRLRARLWRAGKAGTDKWSAPKDIVLPSTGDTDVYLTLGNSSDLWGEASWTSADLANSSFIVELGFLDAPTDCRNTSASADGIAVDHLQVRVHYATPEPAQLPNLTVTKAATQNGSPVSSIPDDQTFQWRWTIANEGEAAAVFDSGEVVLRDELPTGVTYSTTSNFGNISCSVSTGVFTCVANGTLTIEPETTLSVGVVADPATAGTYTNTAANCQVDHLAGNASGNVVESDESDNTCASDASIQVLERRHPRVCLRLVDDGDATGGETATVFLRFDNVTTGSAAGTSTVSYTEAPEAAPMTAGECSDLNKFPVGTVIRVTTTVTSPADFTLAAGYPIARLIPAADPTPPSPEVEFTVGLGDCGVDKNGESVMANDTCNLHLFVKTEPASPPVVLPMVSKTAAPSPVISGFAHWTITIDQPDENWAEQTVVITDAHDDIMLVGDSPCSIDADEITCEVGDEDVTFTVARPITPANLASGSLCAGGTIANHLVEATASGAGLQITTGSSPVAVNVRDTSTCAPATVTKALVAGGESSVSDPADIRWIITLANPAGGLDGVTIEVRDTDAVLVAGSATSGPAGNVDAWCEVESEPFSAECGLPAGASVTFVVVPVETPKLQCLSAPYGNVAEFRLVESETWTEAPGPTITLLGAPSECPQDITIVKHLVNVPEGREIDPSTDLPGLTVPDGEFVSGPTGIDDGTYAWVYTVPPHYAGEVSETVPAGWERVQCARSADGAYTTFCNQPLASIGVTKRFTPNGGPDATDDDLPLSITLEGHGAFVPGGPTANNETSYEPKLVSPGRYTVTETLTPGWHMTGASVSGAGCTEAVPDDLFEAVGSELARAIDILHRETSVTFAAEPGAACQVTFTNERLVATIVVEKVYLGAEGDAPDIAVEVDGLEAGGTWTASGNPVSRWEKVVSVAAAGSSAAVTETIPAGWANVHALVGSCDGADTSGAPSEGSTASVEIESIKPGDTATVCFVNVAVGQIQLLKLETVDSGGMDSWTFTSTAPGLGTTLQTAHSDEPTQAQRTVSLVPVGDYSISETGGREACVPGATASDFETRAAASVGTPPLDEETTAVVGGAIVPFAVEKGQTTYIRFDNVGCGTVLGTGLIVVWKFADQDGDGDRDASEPPVPNWPFTISGPDGTFDVLTDREGKHVFTVAKGGTYTIMEHAADGWLPIGSLQGDAFTPGTTANVAAGLGQQREITFLNQPRVNIEVIKTEFSNASPSGVPGEGWEFTLTGCGITPRTGLAGPDGTFSFDDLPPAVGCTYTVTETQVDGWAAVNPTRTAAPDGPGEVARLSFRNIRIEACIGCVAPNIPSATPTTSPTATPTASQPPAVTETPTVAPGSATAEPSITAVAGERTPGPAGTPIAPNTGAGPQASSGQSFLLWLIGSMAVATGLLVLRLNRRR